MDYVNGHSAALESECLQSRILAKFPGRAGLVLAIYRNSRFKELGICAPVNCRESRLFAHVILLSVLLSERPILGCASGTDPR